MFDVAIDMLFYIFNIRIADIPLHIAYLGMIVCLGYCGALILIGLPCSIWEEITHKKVDHEKEKKIIFRVAICLDVILLLCFLYGAVTP